jgi:hypothetical protein
VLALAIHGHTSAAGTDHVDRNIPLYPTFVTPWLEPNQVQHPVRIEESYHLPACYNLNPISLRQRLEKFADETLFYAFYTSPQDTAQLDAAEELYVSPPHPHLLVTC